MNFIIQNQFFISLGLLVIVGGYLGWHIYDLKKKVSLLFGNTTVVDTSEGLQKELVRRLTHAEKNLEEIKPRLLWLEAISKLSIQKVAFLRFNPFRDTGGDNSFVVALLDFKNNGVLISSLYTREGVRLYGKSIEAGKSKHQLSGEEERVLVEAINKK